MTTNTGTALIQAAHEDAGLCSVGATISSAQQARGLDRMNDLLALYATQGLKVWLQELVTVPLVSGQATYVLGPGGDVNMVRPLQVLQGYYIWAGTANQQPIGLISREEYLRVYQPNVTGAINSFYPNKQATQVEVSFWNTPDATAAAGTVYLSCRVAVSSLASIGLTTVFPQEWAIAIRWGVADDLTSGQSKEIQDRCALRAAAFREALEDFDVEDASTQFIADERAYGGGRSFR